MASKSDHSLWWPWRRLRDRHWADPDGRPHTPRLGSIQQLGQPAQYNDDGVRDGGLPTSFRFPCISTGQPCPLIFRRVLPGPQLAAAPGPRLALGGPTGDCVQPAPSSTLARLSTPAQPLPPGDSDTRTRPDRRVIVLRRARRWRPQAEPRSTAGRSTVAWKIEA